MNGVRKFSTPAAVRIGGMSLILAAGGFIAVFSYLAVNFNYPDVLEGRANTVLPNLLSMGDSGRAVWAMYALLPLLLVPAGIGAHAALRAVAPSLSRSALVASVITAFSMLLGLARWSTIHWELAQSYAVASDESRIAINAIFAGFNAYLGNFIGEFVGELGLNAFFLLTSIAFMYAGRRLVGYAGIVVGVLGIAGAFRNVTPVVQIIADANNSLLPVWLVVLGIVLMRYGRSM